MKKKTYLLPKNILDELIDRLVIEYSENSYSLAIISCIQNVELE